MPAQTTPGLPDPVATVRFATALAKAPSLAELERVFTAGFGRVVGVPMYGFYALEPGQPRIERNVAVNVSDVFVARYDRVMESDPLLERSRSTGRTAYNLAMMSAAEWEESAAYRLAYSTHRMRHVAEIPVTAGSQVLGALHFAASDPAREFAPADLRLAEAIGDALGLAIARIQAARRGEAERERGRLAVELAGIAVVVSHPGLPDLQLNDAARALLGGILDGDEHVYRLMTGPAGAGRFSAGVPVELATGAGGTLHAHAERMPDGALVTVLELRGEQPGLAGRFLRSLTPLAHPDKRVTPLTLDVTSATQIQAAVGRVESLDILVNNAGLGLFDDLSDRDVLERHLAVNLFGTYGMTQAFLPLLTSSEGAIVNVLSLAAMAALPISPAYSISKAAAFSLSQALRALLAGRGVRVHAVFSGPVDTDMPNSRGLDIPKTSPEAVARAIFDGVEEGEEDIFPDPMSQSMAEGWRTGAAKAFERQMATFLPAAPVTS